MTKIVKKRLRLAAGVVVEEQDPDTDRAALVRLFEQSDGDNWKNKASWLDGSAPLAEWHGVSTDSALNVTQLKLNDNGIMKLGAAIKFLRFLVHLDLSNNPLLDGRSSLKWNSHYRIDSKCSTLMLHSLKITCFLGLPDTIGDLKNLKDLNLLGCSKL